MSRMLHPSPAALAALSALRGDADPHVIDKALADPHLANVLALSDTAPIGVRIRAALQQALTSLITEDDFTDPDVRATIRSMIGDPSRSAALSVSVWAYIAPAGWGADMTDALIDAVRRQTLPGGVAAALIGPCDDAAMLLKTSNDASFAIQRWGACAPKPTEWILNLSAPAYERLTAMLRATPLEDGRCLPWLPPDVAAACTIPDTALAHTIHAFADAPDVVRLQHAYLLPQLVARADEQEIGALTRLFLVMPTEDVLTGIIELLLDAPWEAHQALRVAPWHALPPYIRAVIQHGVTTCEECDAIAEALALGIDAKQTPTSAVAFFGAITPSVWHAMDKERRESWPGNLPDKDFHLAIRSLGLQPEVLAWGHLNDDVIRAMRAHIDDPGELRDVLRAIALLPMSVADARAMMSVAVRTPRARAIALAGMVRTAAAARDPIDIRCAALAAALEGQPQDALAPLADMLDDHVRALLMPDRDALADHLADPAQRDAMRRVLERIADMPPDVALPAFHALVALDDASADERKPFASRRPRWFASEDERKPFASRRPRWFASEDKRECFAALDALQEHLRNQHDIVQAFLAALKPELRPPHAAATAHDPFDDHSAAPATAPQGQTHDVLANLAARLSDPAQRDAMRQIMNLIMSMPPDVALPAFHALIVLGSDGADERERAAALDDLQEHLRDQRDIVQAFLVALKPELHSLLRPRRRDRRR